jgi:hypothetical protein
MADAGVCRPHNLKVHPFQPVRLQLRPDMVVDQGVPPYGLPSFAGKQISIRYSGSTAVFIQYRSSSAVRGGIATSLLEGFV